MNGAAEDMRTDREVRYLCVSVPVFPELEWIPTGFPQVPAARHTPASRVGGLNAGRIGVAKCSG